MKNKTHTMPDKTEILLSCLTNERNKEECDGLINKLETTVEII